MAKLTTEGFIKKAREVHGDKYDYSKVEYVGTKSPVIIICKKHGEFQQTPQKHLAGRGCVRCFRESIGERYSMGKKKFTERANAMYNSFYNYDKVNYTNANNYVTITCPLHGDFQQTPSSHLAGHGCPHCAIKKRVENNTKWTYESCYEEAKKYIYKTEFKLAAPTAYTKARENAWLNEYDWFVPLKKDNGFWTKEQCYEEAKKYSSKTEFMNGNPTAYSKSLKYGWSSEYTWFTNDQINVYKGKVDSIYSYIFEEQKTVYVGRTLMKRQKDRDREHIYKTDRDAVAKFAKKKECPVPSMIIIEENLTLEEGQEREKFWIEEYKRQGYTILNKAATGRGTSSLGMIGHGKWSKRACYQEAKKYSCASEFGKLSGSAYAAALSNGWLKDYTWFIKYWEPKWDRETCYQEAIKYKTRGEFQKGNNSAYNKALRNGWIDEYTWLKSRKSKPAGYWNNYENCFNEAKKFKKRNSFQKNCPSGYSNALKNGWLDDYIWFAEKQKHNYWNEQTCYEEAKKYDNITAFARNAVRAYSLARKHGWLKNYTWFKPLTNFWTYEACKAEASKYKKRSHFKKGAPGAFSRSQINGWLDEFFPKKQ